MSPERSGTVGALALLLLGSSFLFISLREIDRDEQEYRPLTVGEIVSGKLSGGERHSYRFSIEPGHAFRVILDPERGDFALALRDPFRSDPLLIDTTNGLRGPEILYAVANAPGQFRLEVSSQAPPGREQSYALKVDLPHPIALEDRLRQEASAAFSRGERLFGSAHRLVLREVADEYGKALHLWQQSEENERAVATLFRLGRTLQRLEENEKALPLLRAALAATRSRRDRLAEAFLLDRIGRSLSLNEAEDWYRSSLTLFRQEKYLPGEADLLNNLGRVHIRRGNFPEGLIYVNEGLKIWRDLGGVREEVYIRHNLGEMYLGLAEPEQALDQFTTALEISGGDRELRARALGGIGAAHSELGQGDQAIQELTGAVELWRDLGERRWEAVNLVRLGEAHARLGRLTQARQKIEEAVALSRRKPPDDWVLAMAMGNLGRVLYLQGSEREALSHFKDAASLFKALDDPDAVVKVLRGHVESALKLGELDTAYKSVQEAIALMESRLRSPFPTDFTLRRELYDLYIEILMSLRERERDERYAAEAFNAAEAARSRSLLDDVKALEVDIPPDDRDLLRKDELEKSLVRLEMRRWAFSKNQSAGKIDRLIRETERTLQAVRTNLEKRGLPGSPRPLTLPEAQSRLEPDTLLLVYHLGPSRSWLWEVGSDRFVTHELAKRSEIEEKANKVHRRLARNASPEWRDWSPDLKRLSKALLLPVADRLEERQLLISPDGILHLTPFAALLNPRTLQRSVEPGPEPGSPRFLMLDHRITMIPSISVVAATRTALSDRPPPRKGVAILAGPDFSGTDFEPLQFSLEEGKAIAAIAGPGQSFLATGRQASRSVAMGPALEQYTYLHFATHGRLRDRPDLSWIALSFLDDQGRQQDGFLRAFEIYDMKLSSELVVLSACETAAGAERGGLVRAFLQAGSRRVMATLWDVPDRSTPHLMESFYQGLLRQGMTPSAALQQAQIEMLSSPWKSPRYWAGFVLQGEWR